MTPRARANFRLYLLARFAAATAITMLRATIAWQVFDLSRSPFQLGLIGIVQFVPALGLSLIGGAVADSYERRRVMMVCESVVLAAALSLCAEAARASAGLPLLYALVLVVSVATTFENPAGAAMLPSLVPREDFPRAVAAATTSRAVAFATGPAAGGFVIAAAGPEAAYLCVGGLLLISIAVLRSLELAATIPSGRRVGWEAIREGLGFVRRQPVVLGCMTLDMFAVVFGGAAALLPVYATDILRVGARGYGVLAAALDVGAILCSLALTALPPIRRAGPTLLATIVAYGVATIVFGLSRFFPLSVAAYLCVGIADQVSVVLRSITIQLATPDELRGRVSSVNLVFIGASNQLGAAESGFLAAATSATFSVVFGGVASIAIVAIVALAFPELRRHRLAGGR